MATLWDVVKQSARSIFTIPPASSYLPSPGVAIERRYHSYEEQYALPHPVRLGTLVSGPGASQLYRDVFGGGDADNSAVAACLNAVCRAYNEVPLTHWRENADGEATPVKPSPLADLFARPNPFMTLRQLRAYWVWCKHSTGNAYLWKSRAADPRTGPVVELWPVSPARIAPVRHKDSLNFIDAYRYYPESGRAFIDIPTENIVHFKLGTDDENHMLGCSNLRRLAREIATDRGATRFANRLLVNNGAASMVVEYDKDARVTREEAAQVKQQLIADFTGENVGSIGVVSPGGKVNRLSLSPSDMDLSSLHDQPHALIAAVIGIPAILAGLPIGLQHATYSNARQLREFFAESFLLPEWADDGETLTHQLLIDFVTAPGQYLAFDIREARALQEDQDARYKRLTEAVGGPWLLADEARAQVGLPGLTPEQAVLLAAQRPQRALPATTAPGEARGLELVERRAG